MGDRAQIVFEFDDEQVESRRCVALYTHNEGRAIFSDLRAILDTDIARNRWDDPEYLTRIVIANIFASYEAHWRETGWGIAPYPMDGETAYVNLGLQTVKVDGRTWTFDEYVADLEAVT